MATMRNIDLKHLVSGNDLIEFLRLEIPDERVYGPMQFGWVCFAYNGVEQEAGFPMDLDKEIFLTRFDETPIKNRFQQEVELEETAWKELADTFRNAIPEIIAAVRAFYAAHWKELF